MKSRLPWKMPAALTALVGLVFALVLAGCPSPIDDSAPVPTSITVTSEGNAETVQAGTTLQFSAVVTPPEASQQVGWSITSATVGVSISNNGLLTVAENVLGLVVVRATAVDHPEVFGTAAVTVLPPGVDGIITWAAVAYGTPTTAINFTFSALVGELTTDDITVTGGTGSIMTGTLTGEGTSWSLVVTGVEAVGTVSVSIGRDGIAVGPQTVTIVGGDGITLPEPDHDCDTDGHIWGEWILTTAPTCTTEGVETRHCGHQGCEHYETRAVGKLGHVFDDDGWELTTPPTATTEGVETRICQREGCDHPETRPIPRLGMEAFTISFADFHRMTPITIPEPLRIVGSPEETSRVIAVDNPVQYEPGSIGWMLGAIRITDGIDGNHGETLTLDSRIHGNREGAHTVTVIVTDMSGVTWSQRITFTVAP